MAVTIQAVYENGLFRPVAPVTGVPEGAAVTLQLERITPPTGEAPRSLSKQELLQLIRSKAPGAEDVPESLWEELERGLQATLRETRDPEDMRAAAERMDRLREQIYQREGLLDLAVPLLREIRDGE